MVTSDPSKVVSRVRASLPVPFFEIVRGGFDPPYPLQESKAMKTKSYSIKSVMEDISELKRIAIKAAGQKFPPNKLYLYHMISGVSLACDLCLNLIVNSIHFEKHKTRYKVVLPDGEVIGEIYRGTGSNKTHHCWRIVDNKDRMYESRENAARSIVRVMLKTKGVT